MQLNSITYRILEQYDLTSASVSPLSDGFNQTYLVTEGVKTVLRIYRLGWRTEAEIHNELSFITHLKSKGVSVAAPLLIFV